MYLIIDAAAAQQFIMKSLEERKSNEVRKIKIMMNKASMRLPQ